MSSWSRVNMVNLTGNSTVDFNWQKVLHNEPIRCFRFAPFFCFLFPPSLLYGQLSKDVRRLMKLSPFTHFLTPSKHAIRSLWRLCCYSCFCSPISQSNAMKRSRVSHKQSDWLILFDTFRSVLFLHLLFCLVLFCLVFRYQNFTKIVWARGHGLNSFSVLFDLTRHEIYIFWKKCNLVFWRKLKYVEFYLPL